MFWTATALLVGVTSALPQVRGPAVLASTYDEAACADTAEEGERTPEEGGLNDCSDRPVSVAAGAPAVIDCNDARMSVWVAEMIGSCDMPRGGDRIVAIQPVEGRSQNRLCDGLHCSREAPPLRAASRDDGGGTPCLFVRRSMHPDLQATPLTPDDEVSPAEVPSRRLERPPRTPL
jgi:hypothetical protein